MIAYSTIDAVEFAEAKGEKTIFAKRLMATWETLVISISTASLNHPSEYIRSSRTRNPPNTSGPQIVDINYTTVS